MSAPWLRVSFGQRLHGKIIRGRLAAERSSIASDFVEACLVNGAENELFPRNRHFFARISPRP
jgi:hypothetical protein